MGANLAPHLNSSLSALIAVYSMYSTHLFISKSIKLKIKNPIKNSKSKHFTTCMHHIILRTHPCTRPHLQSCWHRHNLSQAHSHSHEAAAGTLLENLTSDGKALIKPPLSRKHFSYSQIFKCIKNKSTCAQISRMCSGFCLYKERWKTLAQITHHSAKHASLAAKQWIKQTFKEWRNTCIWIQQT